MEEDFYIIKYNDFSKYATIKSHYMFKITFELYPAIMNNEYDNKTRELFYLFIHSFCKSIVRIKKSKCLPSILLCLACMMEYDKKIVKSHFEYFFIKMIYLHFRNWFFYNNKLTRRIKPIFKLFLTIRNLCSKKLKVKHDKYLIDIKLFCMGGIDYPSFLYDYDKSTFNMRRQIVVL